MATVHKLLLRLELGLAVHFPIMHWHPLSPSSFKPLSRALSLSLVAHSSTLDARHGRMTYMF
eukprot:1369088-Rhodomonas_salina.1